MALCVRPAKLDTKERDPMTTENAPQEGASGGNKLVRRPRATREEMAERRRLVLEKLETGPKTIAELFDDTDLSYPQRQIILRGMEKDGEITKTDKDGREVRFMKREPYMHLPAIPLKDIVATVGRKVELHAMHVEDDDLRIDLKFPDGKVASAVLVA